MRRRAVLCIFAIAIPAVCLAQSNQTELITISTYYPSPYGVYNTLRLYPSDEPVPGSQANRPGAMYFNGTEQKPYIYNGSSSKWERMGSGEAAPSVIFASKILSNHTVKPDQCDGEKHVVNGKLQQCSTPFYQDILFPVNSFTKTPHVLLMPESFPDNGNSPCSVADSDIILLYPANITASGFRLMASSSPNHWGSSACDPDWDPDWYARAIAGWIAVGE